MVYSIALAGKGGTGKTTISGLLLDNLVKNGKGPILAVDADANSNLNEVLGKEKPVSLGEIREEIARSELDEKSPVPMGMSKQEYADFRFTSALAEEDNYDFLVMGRTEGKGCYCYINNVLKEQLKKYYQHYRYLIIDNEAGLEHISRGVLPPVDLILLVSDCSRRGIQAAGRIAAMVQELDIKAAKTGLIVNRAADGEISDGIQEEIALQKLDLLGVIPQDSLVYEYDSAGKPLVELPMESPVRQALEKIINTLKL
ncbi:MAG: AAA family ATPase [Treponema sp.]|nr:AAA family ATPase [Treponema sp.]